jgi:hypothetical protein
MGSYLARYEAGEHEAVWQELVALGDRVREAPLRDDARAVAHETMRRVRHNVELLVPRLRAIGFEFAAPHEAHLPPDPRAAAVLDRLEAAVGPIPLALRAFHEVVGSVCLMGSHPTLSSYTPPPDLGRLVSDMRATVAAHTSEPPPAAPDPLAAFAKVRDMPGGEAFLQRLPPAALDMMRQAMALNQQLMARMAEIPQETERMMQMGVPSARFAETQRLAEALGARMQPPAGAPASAAPVSDPLVVAPPAFDDVDAYRVYEADEFEEGALGDDAVIVNGGVYAIDVSPDDCHKAGQSGGGPYHVRIPDARADAPLVDSPYDSFVDYLRRSFRWGGFPGLADYPPPAELARLTAGLLPI